MCICTKDQTQQNQTVHNLGTPERTWVVSAIHSDADKLIKLHDTIFEHITPNDRILYTGNYSGYGPGAPEVIDELLMFRRLILAQPGFRPSDIIYLRGAQEEMLQKLFQLPFATNPTDIFLWMLSNGLSNTLYAYGLSPHEGMEACKSGVMGLTKWVNKLRGNMRKKAGHEIFSTQYKRAAHTDTSGEYPMLFVNTGIDVRKDLDDQGDNFWWANEQFENMNVAYDPFKKVVRGYDPSHRGTYLNCVSATIDGGCGFGGSLTCAGFDQSGEIVNLFDV